MRPFGVGVEHLDGLPRHRSDDVARTLRAPARHVLDETDDADRVDLGLALGERLHQPDHAGRARHVALHVLHAGGGLQRDAAGVEGDALADQRDRVAALRAGAAPLHDHDVARLLAALPDREQRVHAEPLQRLGSEHFDLHADLCELLRARRELGRAEHVRRLVDEIARERDAVENCARRDEGLVRRFRIVAMHHDLLQRTVVRLGSGSAVFLVRLRSCTS